MSSNNQTYEEYVAIEIEEMASDITFLLNKKVLSSVLELSDAERYNEKYCNSEIGKIAMKILNLAASTEELNWDPKVPVHGILKIDKDMDTAIRNAAAYVRYTLPDLYRNRVLVKNDSSELQANNGEDQWTMATANLTKLSQEETDAILKDCVYDIPPPST
jgi:hypothetical protein